jgi:hypothetical protein
MKKEKKKETFVRINTRITSVQHKFIKEFAKKNEMTEGEATRFIISDFIGKNHIGVFRDNDI